MIKLKITIILLLLCLLFLCVFCFTARDLISDKYNDKVVKFLLGKFVRYDKGLSLVEHYIEQMNFLKSSYIKGFYYLDYEKERKRAYFELTRFMATAFVALVVSAFSLVLIIMHCIGKKTFLSPQKFAIFILLLIVLNGTIIRFIMAYTYYGNSDMLAYERDIYIILKGDNIYSETKNYNYTPIWFIILSFLKYVQMHLPTAIPFHFVVKFFLSMVDLATLVFLLLIADLKKISLPTVALLFYLNPVSFLLTGYHGQFENLTVLMIVIGLYAYLKLYQKPIWGTAMLWFFASAGMIIKHNVFYELIICLNSAVKRYWLKFLMFTVSVCIFLATFLPYWSTGKEGIINNVFKYSSGSGYGIMSLINYSWLKYPFIIGMFVFPLFMKNRDIIRQCLLGFLFFLTFTSGIAIQYFVLPIAIGSLCSSKGFLFYTLAAALYILESRNNVNWPGFNLHLNIIWVCAIFWFISEWFRSRNTSAAISQNVIPDLPKK